MKSKYPPDLLLVTALFILLGLGLVMNYSASAIYALEKYGSTTYFFWKQLVWVALGLMSACFFVVYDHRKLRNWVRPLLLVSLVLLIAVLVTGREIGGAKRWIRIAGFGFQPSEFVKIVMVLFVAYYCDKKKSKIQDFKSGLLPVLIVIGLFSGFIFLQPDLGTPVLILITAITMIFIAGGKVRQMILLILSLVPFVAWAVWLKPYRVARVLSFLNPWEHAQGKSYQLVQSLLAFGSGGLTGTGLGESNLKLLYLPEPHTDFIFPIFAEEFGLIGSLFVLFLFGLLAWAGFRVATRSVHLFSSLLASGITLMVLYQAVINIAMVTGCMPTKGLPLPFISFGGSSIVMTLSAIGILLNISRYARKE